MHERASEMIHGLMLYYFRAPLCVRGIVLS